MPTYTVHEPPPRKGKAASSPERFVFVRDGFYVWAFLLAPLWLLRHRLWLALVLYLLWSIAIGIALFFLGVPPAVKYFAILVTALVMGLEAATVWRWTLEQRRWKTLGFVIGDDAETAERRFYAAWTKGADKTPVLLAEPEPQYSVPVRRGPPSPSDVIGLFPEPGGGR